MSVAGVALANRLNTNLLARWCRNYRIAQAAGTTSAMIPFYVVESQAAPFPSRAQSSGDAVCSEFEIQQADTVLFIRGTPDSTVLGLLLRELLQAGCGIPK